MTIEEDINDRFFCLNQHNGNLGAYAFQLQFGNCTGEHIALEIGRNLKSYDSMDSVGRRSIVARIPVSVAFGYVNHWEGALDSLWFDVSE